MINNLLQYLFIIGLKVLAITWRISKIGENEYDRAVIAFWHGKMLPIWKLFSHKNSSAVISLSKDGDVLANLLQSWNYVVLRGSSSKGGKEVLEEMVKHAKKSKLLITPDGPRGPIYKLKPGAVIASQRAGVPLIICKVEIKWKITLKSWDKFEIPLPFSKIFIQFLPPITISQNTERNDISMLINECEILLSEKITFY
ncbi:MAG: lysophospholipid acyltransferase family protein [Bacteroidetes bacterium]|nr:lysophospholipid acyltransferase family protein [Bacteroidota bacterium]